MIDTDNNFPLVYCNGDSYSDNNYHKTLHKSTYDFVVANEFDGFNINNAVGGSCNRRIIRASVADLIQQRDHNPNQRIIALIGLSFDLRSEFWNEDFLKRTSFEINHTSSLYESDFKSFQFTGDDDWLSKLRSGDIIRRPPDNVGTNFTKKFFNILNNSRAYFFSPYAERINLYCDLIMFRSLMDSLNIEFLVFHAPAPELIKTETDATLHHFSHQIHNDKRFIGFEDGFGFCTYLADNNFVPLDFIDNPTIGHYKSDGHEFFAKNIILPLLNEA